MSVTSQLMTALAVLESTYHGFETKRFFAPQIRLICEMNEKLASGASYALCNNILDSTQS